MAKSEKILFLGVGSPNDPGFEDVKIGGQDYREYMKDNRVTVIGPVIESCHGCPDLMSKYSRQLQYMVEEKGARVVAVLQGGLYFALPSIQAKDVTFPIISGPLDEVAQLGIAVPPGHAAIAGTDYERHRAEDGKKIYETAQRQKALMAAERMLNLLFNTVAVYDESGKLEKKLGEFGIEKDDASSLLLTHHEYPVGFTNKRRFPNVRVELFCNSSGGFPRTDKVLDWDQNNPYDIPAVEIYGVQNLAIFAAKVLSLENPGLREMIKEIAAKKRESYPERDLLEELGMK